MKRVLSFLLPIAAMAALAFPAMLQAANLDPIDSAGVQVQQQQQNGINYLSGGIGLDESKAIQQTPGYNLHMTCSVGMQNEYAANVDVTIEKASGQTVLTLNQAGPLVYVQLPPGKYIVRATLNGQERRDVTDVGSGTARNLVFHWSWSGQWMMHWQHIRRGTVPRLMCWTAPAFSESVTAACAWPSACHRARAPFGESTIQSSRRLSGTECRRTATLSRTRTFGVAAPGCRCGVGRIGSRWRWSRSSNCG